MKLVVNGNIVEIDGITHVSELASRLNLPPHTVLIEHNGLALHQREWPERVVAAGDRIEFLRVVAGG